MLLILCRRLLTIWLLRLRPGHFQGYDGVWHQPEENPIPFDGNCQGSQVVELQHVHSTGLVLQ